MKHSFRIISRFRNEAFSSAFTLIELLVVVAIIAILAVVVVLTLNPAQLLAQSRDANRVSDMATINSAITLYQADQGGNTSMGTSTYVYLSLPDASSTCGTQGLPALPSSTYSYYCGTSTSSRITNGNGWIPLNFNNVSAGSPFSSIPVDPTNQTSSNLYYAYSTQNSQYVVSSFLESTKYAKNMANTGGIDPALYEVGTGVNTIPDLGRGLVGYWPLNEGSGSISGTSQAIDWSGAGNNGTWYGTPTGTNGTYYSTGKTGSWAGVFDGSSTYISTGKNSLPLGNNSRTMSAWIYYAGLVSYPKYYAVYSYGNAGTPYQGSALLVNIGNGVLQFDVYGCSQPSSLVVSPNVWHFIAITYQAGSLTYMAYIDGSSQSVNLASSSCKPNTTLASTNPSVIGEGNNNTGSFFLGSVDDIRVYNRALSTTEIQQIYNAEK